MHRLLIAACLLVVACHKAEPEPALSPPAEPRPPSVAPATAPGPDLRDPLALMPAGALAVLRLDLAALRKSPLWGTYAPLILTELAPGFVGCGYDPFGDVSTVTAALSPAADGATFVVRGLDRAKTLRCLAQPDRGSASRNTATIDGDVITLENQSGNVNVLAFVDDHDAILLSSQHAPTREAVHQAVAVGAPLRARGDAQRLEASLAAGAALSIVLVPGTILDAGITKVFGVHAAWLSGTLDVTDHIELHSRVEFATPADAATAAEHVRPTLARVLAGTDTYDVHVDGAAVIYSATASEATVRAAFEAKRAKARAGAW